MSMSPSDVSKFGLMKRASLLRLMGHMPRRICNWGDSITQSNSNLDTTHGLWSLGSGYSEQGIFQAGPHFTMVGNFGVWGQTTAQILARSADVLAAKPDIVVLMAGTNDFTTNAGNTELAACMNNIEKMVLLLLAQNILPVIVTPPVKNSTSPADGSTIGGAALTRQAIPYYYRLAHYYGLPLVDAFKVTCDPKTGAYITGYSADGVHPQTTGITAIANALASTLQNLNNWCPTAYVAAYSELSSGMPANLIRNGGFAQQATANVPDGWGTMFESNATWTAATASVFPYCGKDFAVTKTTNDAGYGLYSDDIAVNTAFKAGDALYFSGRLKVSGLGASGISGFSMNAAFANGGNAQPINTMTMGGDWTFSQEIIVPSNPGNLNITSWYQDKGTYLHSSFTLINKTAQDTIWQPGKQ